MLCNGRLSSFPGFWGSSLMVDEEGSRSPSGPDIVGYYQHIYANIYHRSRDLDHRFGQETHFGIDMSLGYMLWLGVSRSRGQSCPPCQGGHLGAIVYLAEANHRPPDRKSCRWVSPPRGCTTSRAIGPGAFSSADRTRCWCHWRPRLAILSRGQVPGPPRRHWRYCLSLWPPIGFCRQRQEASNLGLDRRHHSR